MTSSRKPVALVTGANKGIGFEVSRALATGREAADTLTSEGLDVRFVELGCDTD